MGGLELVLPHGQTSPSHAVSREQDSMCQHRANIQAVWGGAKPLTAFWKNEGFISRAFAAPRKGWEAHFSPLLFSSNCRDLGLELCSTPKAAAAFAGLSDCCRDHLQSFGILLSSEAQLMDGDSPTPSTSSSPPCEMKALGSSVAAAQHLAELSSLPRGMVFQRYFSP